MLDSDNEFFTSRGEFDLNQSSKVIFFFHFEDALKPSSYFIFIFRLSPDTGQQYLNLKFNRNKTIATKKVKF